MTDANAPKFFDHMTAKNFTRNHMNNVRSTGNINGTTNTMCATHTMSEGV